MGRAASQNHRAGAGEIHPPPDEYHFPNNKRGWIRIPRVLRPFSPRTGDQSRNIRPNVDGSRVKRCALPAYDDPLSPPESSSVHSSIVHRLRESATPFALSSLALALILAVSHKFHLNTAIVVLLCLLITVLHALADGLISSAIISLIAGTCLVYFFVPPLFSFRIKDPLEVVAFGVFLIVANGMAWLVSKAHGALRDSRRQLALAESVAPLALWSCDLRTKVIVPSREYLRLYGLRADSSPLTWQQWLGLIHPDDRDRLERVMYQSLEQTHVWDTEFRVVWPDGSFRWLLGKGTVLLDASGKPSRLVGVYIDITEGKQAEAALRESDERFRVTFFQAAVGIAQTSLDGQWLLLNPRFCEILGYSEDELRGKTFVDMTHPDDREASLSAHRKFLAGEIASWSSEKRYIRKDGITVWARVFVSLVRNKQNEAQYLVSVVEDITEKIQAERALQQSRQELRALAGRLIDAEETERKRIARELHDDLSQKLALLAFDTGSLVLAPPSSLEEMKEPLRNLQTRVVQLSQDVRQISHRLHPSILEDLGLTAALQELCEELSAREGIEIVFEQEAVPKALPVEIASCLYRVSQAALHNVIKHSRANQAQLKVSGSPEGIQLRIHDTGVGFDSESASPQNGLGIVSMKERVLLVQGEFSICSRPGQGTTVEIFVPLSREAI
jgi:PAS domain S-box-containing protein